MTNNIDDTHAECGSRYGDFDLWRWRHDVAFIPGVTKMVATSETAPVAAPVASTPHGKTDEQGGRDGAADAEQGGRQMPEAAVRFIPLVWTENLSPTVECRYDHCKANTPFGIFLITWSACKQPPALATLLQ